jgi:hypothetical protein
MTTETQTPPNSQPNNSTTTPPAGTTPANQSSTPPATSGATSNDQTQTNPPGSAATPPAAGSEAVIPPAGTPPGTTPPTEEGYELELAEDSPLSDEQFDAIVEYASKYNMSKDDAAALLKREEDLIKGAKTSAEAVYQQKIQGMKTEMFSHPLFKDEATRKESYAHIARAVQVFGNAKVVEKLKDPENGYDLDIALVLYEAGKALGPDTSAPPVSNGSTGPSERVENTERARNRRMYSIHFDKK